MKYTLYLTADGWYWELHDGNNAITDPVGPHETEVQAMVSMLAYSAKVEL